MKLDWTTLVTGITDLPWGWQPYSEDYGSSTVECGGLNSLRWTSLYACKRLPVFFLTRDGANSTFNRIALKYCRSFTTKGRAKNVNEN